MRDDAPLVETGRGRWLVLLAGLVALLPDLAASLPGRSYFFRDFSVTFYPLRLFFARELREGRVPFWNPYIYEGSFSLPTFYPVDLLHVLDSGPAAVSWLLTLHLPLAAIGALFLARELGADSWGSFVAGSVRPGRPLPLLAQPLRVPPGPGPGPLPRRGPPPGRAPRRTLGSGG
jgi:hypothetical protein